MEEECRAELRRRRRTPGLLSPPAAPLTDLPDSAADVLSPAECLLELKVSRSSDLWGCWTSSVKDKELNLTSS